MIRIVDWRITKIFIYKIRMRMCRRWFYFFRKTVRGTIERSKSKARVRGNSLASVFIAKHLLKKLIVKSSYAFHN